MYFFKNPCFFGYFLLIFFLILKRKECVLNPQIFGYTLFSRCVLVLSAHGQDVFHRCLVYGRIGDDSLLQHLLLQFLIPLAVFIHTVCSTQLL